MTDQINAHFNQIGEEFVNHYYSTFTNAREGLKSLFADNSMMSWEGQQFQGVANIMGKIGQLPAKVVYQVVTRDCQPSPNNGVLVFVAGDLKIDDGPTMKFSQVFHLLPNTTGGYYCFNTMFRLNIG